MKFVKTKLTNKMDNNFFNKLIAYIEKYIVDLFSTSSIIEEFDYLKDVELNCFK